VISQLEELKKSAPKSKLSSEEISTVIANFLAKVPPLEGLKEQINDLKRLAIVANQSEKEKVDEPTIPIQPAVEKPRGMTKRAKRSTRRVHFQHKDKEQPQIKESLNSIVSDKAQERNDGENIKVEIESTIELLNTFLPDCQYSDEQRNIINQVHNSTVGHFGVERTVKRLKELGHHWPYMRLHVRKFIHLCPVCEKMSERNILTVTRPFTVSNFRPMEQLHVDVIGPVKLDAKEVKYVLVIIDSFTRFVELFPLVENTAKEIVECLIHHFGRYGTPISIKSDGGSEFINELNNELSLTAQFAKIKATAYSKQENSLVERANKEVFRHLRAIIFDKGVTFEWDKYLPFVQRIMNASTHSSLGVSPAQLMFGNSIDLDRGILYDDNHQSQNQINQTDINLSDWITEKLEIQKKILNIARKHQKDIDTTNTINRANFEEITGKTEYPINSYVLARYKSSQNNNRAPSKVLMPWRGPFRVVDHRDDTYTIHNLPEDKYEEYHVSFLKPFVYDEQVTAPRLVANKDLGFFDVDRVLNHSGQDKKVSTYKFLIRWRGYDDSHNTWEQWENVRNNLVVHQYLREHKLASLIPRKFKIRINEVNDNNDG
jgi:hypothetical protein